MLKNLHAERIGPHVVFDVDFARPVNVFVGAGGAGKSHVVQILQWLFTGRVEGVTDAKGSFVTGSFGYDGTWDFLARSRLRGRSGEDIVWSRIQEGPSLTNQRVVLEINGVEQAGKREQLTAQFYAMTCGAASWFIMLNAERFGNLTQVEQSKTVAMVMGGQTTPEELRDKVMGALGRRNPSPTTDQVASAMKYFSLEPKPFEWDITKKHFEDKRRGVRNIIETVTARIKAGAGEPDAKRLSELRLRKSQYEAERNAILREPAPTEAEITEAENALAALPNPSSEDVAKLEAAKSKASAAEDKLRASPVVDTTPKIAQIKESIKLAGKKKNDKPCPFCGHVLDNAALVTLNANLAEAEKQAKEFQKWNAEVSAAEIKTDETTEALGKVIAGVSAYKAAAEKVKKLKDRAEACKLRRPMADIESDLNGMMAEIVKLEEAEKRSDEIAKDKVQLANQQTEEAALNALIDVYAPDGVRQELTKKRDQFLAAVDTGLKFFFNSESVRVWLDAGKLSLTGDEANARPFSRLSESERARLGFAIQCAVGVVDNCWMAVTDHFSEVAPNDQNTIIDGLAEALGDHEGTAILIMQIPRPETERMWSLSEDERAVSVKFSNPAVQVFAVKSDHTVLRVE